MGMVVRHPSTDVLTSLPNALLSGLFANATPVNLEPGQVLFRNGDEGDGCYQLEQGVVKVVMSSSHDNERIIAILGPGSVIGELSVLDGLPRSASIIAIRECHLKFITSAVFKQFAKAHPEIFELLTKLLARRLRETDELLAATSFMKVKARLARAFLELATHLGQGKGDGTIDITHRISQSDLAAMAGIARENVARTLTEWKQQNLVTQSAHFYRLNDLSALQRQVELGER
jgi:CRP/FNR family transcriptional regulator